MKSTFTYNEITLEYLTLGEGNNAILCLHGFGREAEDFTVFTPLLQTGQRMVSINLLAHSNSSFPEERINKQPISKSEWSSLLLALLKSLDVERFHLIGYSMGGRLAMVLAEHSPEKIKSLILIAPDGLKVNWIYRFVSETIVGRILYRSIIGNPGWLIRTVDFLRLIGLLHPKIQRFVHGQLETRAKRQLVYDAWLIHRLLFPRLSIVAANIEAHEIPFELIFGTHDKVIPADDGRRLLRHFKETRQPVMLNLGHRMLHPTTVRHLADSNMWMPSKKA